MATQTFQHSSFGGGAVRVEFDVNNANWRVSQVRCINNSASAARFRVLLNGTEVYSDVAPAGQTTTRNTTGLQLGWDAVDGGIQMGGYVFEAAWPA
jgi:hypothetical protein